MGGLFSKPKKVKIPPAPKPPPPIPTPEETAQEAQRKKEAERKRLMAAVGRRGTILTGTLGEPLIGKATLLGKTS